MEKLEATLKTNPENPATYLSLGYIYQQSSENEKAMQFYERALESNPNLWAAANNLAALLSVDPGSDEDLERALILAISAQALRPGEPAVLNTLGWIYYQMGDMNQALDLLENSLTGEPESPIFNYHMGMVLL